MTHLQVCFKYIPRTFQTCTTLSSLWAGGAGSSLPARQGGDIISLARPASQHQHSAPGTATLSDMGDSDMSPKAKVTYDQHKFEVEFNVSEYLPEVRESHQV